MMVHDLFRVVLLLVCFWFCSIHQSWCRGRRGRGNKSYLAPSPAAPSHEPVASVTQISAHIRNTSKCPQDVIKLLESIYITYAPHFNTICDNPESNVIKSGLSADYAALVRIEDLLKEFSNSE